MTDDENERARQMTFVLVGSGAAGIAGLSELMIKEVSWSYQFGRPLLLLLSEAELT